MTDRRTFLAALTATLAGGWLGRVANVPGSVTIPIAPAIQDAVATTLAHDGAGIRVGMVLLNTRTRENILVTSIAKDAITVVRGLNSIALPFEPTDVLFVEREVFADGA